MTFHMEPRRERQLIQDAVSRLAEAFTFYLGCRGATTESAKSLTCKAALRWGYELIEIYAPPAALKSTRTAIAARFAIPKTSARIVICAAGIAFTEDDQPRYSTKRGGWLESKSNDYESWAMTVEDDEPLYEPFKHLHAAKESLLVNELQRQREINEKLLANQEMLLASLELLLEKKLNASRQAFDQAAEGLRELKDAVRGIEPRTLN
ncbi:TPA: hypothetical protein ACF4EW_002560 [Pseudomonas aeruginosa]